MYIDNFFDRTMDGFIIKLRDFSRTFKFVQVTAFNKGIRVQNNGRLEI